jgi:hypothetical protein
MRVLKPRENIRRERDWLGARDCGWRLEDTAATRDWSFNKCSINGSSESGGTSPSASMKPMRLPEARENPIERADPLPPLLLRTNNTPGEGSKTHEPSVEPSSMTIISESFETLFNTECVSDTVA